MLHVSMLLYLDRCALQAVAYMMMYKVDTALCMLMMRPVQPGAVH